MLYEDSEEDIEILSPTPTYTAIIFLGCIARGEYFFRKNISQKIKKTKKKTNQFLDWKEVWLNPDLPLYIFNANALQSQENA